MLTHSCPSTAQQDEPGLRAPSLFRASASAADRSRCHAVSGCENDAPILGRLRCATPVAPPPQPQRTCVRPRAAQLAPSTLPDKTSCALPLRTVTRINHLARAAIYDGTKSIASKHRSMIYARLEHPIG